MTSPLNTLAEPRREQILRLVWLREQTAGNIAASMPVTFGAVSQHLKVLREAGLVSVRREGKRRWYAANKAALGALGPALEEMWFGKLGELKRLAEAEQKSIDAARAGPVARRKHPPTSANNKPRKRGAP